ncbi:hypothetical protein GLAREA_00335 [Glarea lozoyensis ATCC 20868]|uniref:2EXR domain-containing protein n=2 Tax=Glarea lozoyensis TaxID=101852 RepID=S3CU30_GLAL2|nr:uncharacterized protein GLAREA_00335 [Glarea lozoyensis ATCC 20868]EHL03385.1 hypothetical protein M7I_0607 [Glarea lozoyensis 74030]EPE29175.1 hypothetical protein GLAREA_00335 [Glarea lozoyensis ATCC 20868]
MNQSDGNDTQARKATEFDDLPTEIQTKIAREAQVPRTIIIQGCDVVGVIKPAGTTLEENLLRETSQYVTELLMPYENPTLLQVNHKLQDITLRYYEQILQSAISVHGVFYDHNKKTVVPKHKDELKPIIRFNFEVDTLAFSPNFAVRETIRNKESGEVESLQYATSEKRSPADSFGILKDLLKSKNNVERVENIAIGDFRWAKVRNEQYHHDEARQPAKAFNDQIKNGFRNLKNLFLIYNEIHDPDDEDMVFYKLDTSEDQGTVRKKIIAMFEKEKRQSACKVPKITFISDNDEKARQYLPKLNIPKRHLDGH